MELMTASLSEDSICKQLFTSVIPLIVYKHGTVTTDSRKLDRPSLSKDGRFEDMKLGFQQSV